jgi:hypothetical protein
MAINERFCIVPSFSMQPNKLVMYNSVFRKDYENELLIPIQQKSKSTRINKEVLPSFENLSKNRTKLEVSDNGYRTLQKKINWLYYLSKSRYKKTNSGKEIFNFKMNFLTLSLPTKQRTSTKEVTSSLLNNFLTEIRQRTKMTNYVWRLEFQKNGNVHYHIVTDTYLDYHFVLNIWNRLLRLNGYIKGYTDKHINLNLSEYNKMYNSDGTIDFSVMAK